MASFFRYAQLVIGPAGSGKSTYCQTIQNYGTTIGKNFRVLNLDPAAEVFRYRCDIDIRDLVSLSDVMASTDLGPNGGLVMALEYVNEHSEWLQEQLDSLGEDDYILIDCPGQVELYTHLPVMQNFVVLLNRLGFNVCGVYCVDITILSDPTKYISAALM